MPAATVGGEGEAVKGNARVGRHSSQPGRGHNLGRSARRILALREAGGGQHHLVVLLTPPRAPHGLPAPLFLFFLTAITAAARVAGYMAGRQLFARRLIILNKKGAPEVSGGGVDIRHTACVRYSTERSVQYGI